LPKIFDQTLGIHDSKLLSPKIRERLSGIIKKRAIYCSIAEISVEIINEEGIGKATQRAFKKALDGLPIIPHHILIDAYYIENIEKQKQTPIIKGDQKSISIAAASIIAKVYRDALMCSLHKLYANYGFFTNKGYGTKKHQEAIKQFGLCPLHRSSFNLLKYTNPPKR